MCPQRQSAEEGFFVDPYTQRYMLAALWECEVNLWLANCYFARDSSGVPLSGQVKSGQRWSGQKRPMDVVRDLDVVLCCSLSGQV